MNKQFRMRLGFEIDVESVNLSEIRAEVLAKFLRRAYEANHEELSAKGAAGIVMAHGSHSWAQITDRMEKSLSELLP